MKYNPSIYEKATLDEAKDIILRPQHGVPTDKRWIVETDWTMDRVRFPHGALVFDVGCGIGRLAKPLVQRGHYVMGVDISASMRRMANEYVDDMRFAAFTPEQFLSRIDQGLRGQGAIAAWAFQHIPAARLRLLVDGLYEALDRGSLLFTLERPERWIPVEGEAGKLSWENDHVSVANVLTERGFIPTTWAEPPLTCCKAGAALTRWERP